MPNQYKSIVLAGFMATGKSTVGLNLAKRMNRVFYDTDTLIQQRTRLTIDQIFERYGESYFRAVERGIIHECALISDSVIAIGGGAIIDGNSRQLLLQETMIICLQLNHQQLKTRLESDGSRPLATNWLDKLNQRQPIYDSLPHQINTTNKTTDQITDEILALWQTLFTFK